MLKQRGLCELNLRSGARYFFFFASLAREGKKITPSSRKQFTETKREGVIAGYCELSEIAETFSIVNVTVFRFFIYFMYENMGAVDD